MNQTVPNPLAYRPLAPPVGNLPMQVGVPGISSNDIAMSSFMTQEDIVLRHIMADFSLQNRIVAHLDQELFELDDNKHICYAIREYNKKFSRFPTYQEIKLTLPQGSVASYHLDQVMAYPMTSVGPEFIHHTVMKFFKTRRTKQILIKAAEKIHSDRIDDIDSIVPELEKALGFNLVSGVGFDLIDDLRTLLLKMKAIANAIPSAISELNAATKKKGTHGGYYKKAVSLYMGQPNVGKTLFLCNDAAHAFRLGYNVLYISLEMAEELLAERVIANLCNVPIFDVVDYDADDLTDRLNKNFTEENTPGKFFFRRLPTTTNPADIERCINEILLTKAVAIDLVVVDYLGIMKPQKRAGVDTNSLYSIGKDVIEQLRDMADRTNTAVLTASQMNRDGYDELMASLKNTAGSAGINETADLIVTIARDAALRERNMFFHMILKNRFGENCQVFHSEFERKYMRVTDATQSSVDGYHQTLGAKQVDIKNFTRVASSIPDISGKSKEEKKEQEQKYIEKFGGATNPVYAPEQHYPLNPEIIPEATNAFTGLVALDIDPTHSNGPMTMAEVSNMPNRSLAEAAANFGRNFR